MVDPRSWENWKARYEARPHRDHAAAIVRVTHIGGPTVLLEIGDWRILTDPTFDAPGRRYTFGWGTASRKLTGPALAADELPPLDAVLLSHDHHDDNLDEAGRALLPRAETIVTTTSGARRLGGSARGLEAWGDDHARGARAADDRDHRHAMPARAAGSSTRSSAT